jgi:hypothetical protein
MATTNTCSMNALAERLGRAMISTAPSTLRSLTGKFT